MLVFAAIAKMVLRGGLPPAEMLDSCLRNSCEELTKEATAAGQRVRVLASSFVGTTWYAAVRHIGPRTKERPAFDFVTAYVFLRHHGFGYKCMSETMGPITSDCPGYILDMLSPVEQLGVGPESAEWATDWRERCRNMRTRVPLRISHKKPQIKLNSLA